MKQPVIHEATAHLKVLTYMDKFHKKRWHCLSSSLAKAVHIGLTSHHWHFLGLQKAYLPCPLGTLLCLPAALTTQPQKSASRSVLLLCVLAQHCAIFRIVDSVLKGFIYH